MYLVDHPIFKIIAERQDAHLVNHVQLSSSETEMYTSQPLTTTFNNYKIPTVLTCRSWGWSWKTGDA